MRQSLRPKEWLHLNLGYDFEIDFDSSKMSQDASNDAIWVGSIWNHAFKIRIQYSLYNAVALLKYQKWKF